MKDVPPGGKIADLTNELKKKIEAKALRGRSLELAQDLLEHLLKEKLKEAEEEQAVKEEGDASADGEFASSDEEGDESSDKEGTQRSGADVQQPIADTEQPIADTEQPIADVEQPAAAAGEAAKDEKIGAWWIACYLWKDMRLSKLFDTSCWPWGLKVIAFIALCVADAYWFVQTGGTGVFPTDGFQSFKAPFGCYAIYLIRERIAWPGPAPGPGLVPAPAPGPGGGHFPVLEFLLDHPAGKHLIWIVAAVCVWESMVCGKPFPDPRKLIINGRNHLLPGGFWNFVGRQMTPVWRLMTSVWRQIGHLARKGTGFPRKSKGCWLRYCSQQDPEKGSPPVSPTAKTA